MYRITEKRADETRNLVGLDRRNDLVGEAEAVRQRSDKGAMLIFSGGEGAG